MNRMCLPRRALWSGIAVALLNCGGPSPVAPIRAPVSHDLLGSLWSSVSLLTCTPLPADSVTQTVGPAGGVLQVGPHTLTIPAGALDSTVTITAVAPSDTVNRVHFEPHGLAFQHPASLTLNYANCAALALPKRVAYTTDALAILALLPSLDDALARRVTAQVSHFSNYAVAW